MMLGTYEYRTRRTRVKDLWYLIRSATRFSLTVSEKLNKPPWERTMDTERRERIFEQALRDYRDGRLAAATKSMGHLVQEGSRDPIHISYYGLLLAFTHGRNKQSISLCEEAVEKDGRRSSVLYLNLARALAAQGRRREAIATLARGAAIHQTDRRLRRELQHLVPRRKPLIPSLGRKHPVNKCYGFARTLGGRMLFALTARRRTI